MRLGERERGTARLEEAVSVHHAALQERTRELVPLGWAYSNQWLANALADIAVRLRSPVYMAEAIDRMLGVAEMYRQAHATFWVPLAESRVAEMKEELAKMEHLQNQPVHWH